MICLIHLVEAVFLLLPIMLKYKPHLNKFRIRILRFLMQWLILKIQLKKLSILSILNLALLTQAISCHFLKIHWAT